MKRVFRWKIVLLTLLLSIGTVAGAYAGVQEFQKFPKTKNPSQEVGNNWEIKNNALKIEEVQIDHSKKNLKLTDEDIAKAKEDRETRPHPDKLEKSNIIK